MRVNTSKGMENSRALLSKLSSWKVQVPSSSESPSGPMERANFLPRRRSSAATAATRMKELTLCSS